MLLDPPVPVLAEFRPLSPVLDVTFDKPLRPGTSAAGNWDGRRANRLWTPLVDPTVAGSVVTITTIPGPVEAGSDFVTYAASPPDVVSFPGLVAAPGFLKFPVT